jgi:hypothetical protein
VQILVSASGIAARRGDAGPGRREGSRHLVRASRCGARESTDFLALANIDVERARYGASACTVAIRLTVRDKRRSSSTPSDATHAERAILQEMASVGVRRNDALALLQKYGVDRVKRTLSRVTHCRRQRGWTADSVLCDLEKAIQKDCRSGHRRESGPVNAVSAPRQPAPSTAERERAQRTRFEACRREQAWRVFEAQSSAQKNETWHGYLKTMKGGAKAILWAPACKRGIASMAVRVDFLNWLADQLF